MTERKLMMRNRNAIECRPTNIVVICDNCPGRNDCPADNKDKRVSCPEELYLKYHEMELQTDDGLFRGRI